MQIKELEAALGTPLFERSARQLRLTGFLADVLTGFLASTLSACCLVLNFFRHCSSILPASPTA